MAFRVILEIYIKIFGWVYQEALLFNSRGHTVGEKKDSTKRYLWSKTILTTGRLGGPGADPPPRKINAFFLRSLALRVPIYRHFQSNGANWRSFKL